MTSLSGKSQNITASTEVTVDNEVITPDDYSGTAQVSAGLLPLWYITILELQKSEVVIDSLRASLDNANKAIKHYSNQLGNTKKQNEKLTEINRNLQRQVKLATGDADAMTKYYLRWRRIGRVAVGVSAFFAVLAIAK